MTFDSLECGIHYGWNWKDAIEDAEARGMKVYQSTDSTLLLDLDDEDSLKHYEFILPIFQRKYELREMDRWHSKSGTGWHVIISCPICDMPTRILFQALLGSDRTREALAFMMYQDGIENCSWLFRPKES